MRPFEADSKAWMIIDRQVVEGKITGISTYTYRDWVTAEYYTFEYNKGKKRPNLTNLGNTLFVDEEGARKELEYQNKCEDEYYS